jgi:Cof subfamily protein (haloacid dehalogenase superfamily)
MPELFVSDLDGTLLRGNHLLSDFARDALARMIEEGLSFTVASARSVVSMRPLLKGLPLRLPVVELNGAFLTDLETGEHLVVNDMDPDVLEELFGLVERCGCVPVVVGLEGREDRVYHAGAHNAGLDAYLTNRLAAGDPRFRQVSDLREGFRNPVVSLMVMERAEVLGDLAARIRETYDGALAAHLMADSYAPGWHWLTIHDRKASKAEGVRILAEQLGVAAEDLVVFGDDHNDTCLFEMAGRGVAVENAVEALKTLATEVIGSNEEDSVVKYIIETRKAQR